MSDKTIKFHLIKSLPEDLVLAPVASKKLIPEWFKHIPPKVDNNGEEIPSVKKCIPFLDAMSMGYTLLMHVDVVIQQLENGEIRLPYIDKEHKQVLEAHKPIETHPSIQAMGSVFESMPILKYMNPWTIETPKDYSLLFLPPINRLENPIIPLVGFVDTDTYINVVNIPFIHTGLEPGKQVVIPAGTPICQIIPIKRDNWSSKVTLYDNRQLKAVEKQRKQMWADVRDDYYAKHLHKKKGYN